MSLTRISNCPNQFLAEHGPGCHIPIELEAPDQYIDRETVVQHCKHAVPGRRFFQASATGFITVPGERQSTSRAVVAGPRQVITAGRAKVFITAWHTAHQAVAGKDDIQGHFQPAPSHVSKLAPSQEPVSNACFHHDKSMVVVGGVACTIFNSIPGRKLEKRGQVHPAMG